MKFTFTLLIAIALMMQMGIAHAAKAAWKCEATCELGSQKELISTEGISAKHAILDLQAKLAQKPCGPNAIEGALCKNSKTGASKGYSSLKTLLGLGPNGEKGGS